MVRISTLTAALLLTTPAVASAQAPAPAPTAVPTGPVISFSITESIDAPPDMAVINTGVETRALNARDAVAQNAAQMDSLMKALVKAGIERKDIQTSGISLSPQYDYAQQRTPGDGPRFIGYQAANMLTVTLRRLDKSGETLDAMVAAGATNLNGPNFGIADTARLRVQARDQAIRAGQAQAAAYARTAGFGRAKLLSIDEGGGAGWPMPVAAMRAANTDFAGPSTKIEPGQLSTSITLSFRYMLEP